MVAVRQNGGGKSRAGARLRSRRNKPMSEINVTPMVDVLSLIHI